MWRPLRGLSLDASPEMPHAEKNLSHHVYDSSIEPCLKKSRPDYSSSWVRRDTDLYKEHESKSHTWTFSPVSEERYHQPYQGEVEGGRGGVNVKYDSVSPRSGQGSANDRHGNDTNQHSVVLPGRERSENNSDVMFSGTSTAFIGPLYRPSAQEKSVPEVASHLNAKSPPSKIATVELGKFASQSKSQDGMDYELRQFYKELNELEAEAGDQTKAATYAEADVRPRISPYPDSTPTTLPSNQHHGQVPTSQPPAQFASTSSNFVSVACRAREEPRPQLNRPPLPLNNLFSCDGQAPYPPTNFSLVSRAVAPPSRFEDRPPPTFIVPYGPPPPRFNYPTIFPKHSDSLFPPPSLHFTYDSRNGPPPWEGSPAPPQRRYTPQVIPYNEPFSQGAGERTWQDIRSNHLGRPEDGPFDEILPPWGNASHEQYLGSFRDKSRRMVLLRGVPGSGKSTLARTLLRRSPDGVVLSTDDYFCQENGYTYDVKLLGDAHSWNQNRARSALDDGRSPVIIDNTNSQAWEMKPYVQMAVDRDYDVEFLEPDTWWKLDPQELEKRNTHRVPRETISKMLERYEYDMTVPVVMNSVDPRRIRPNRPPLEAHPRGHDVRKKRHRKRNRNNGKKHSLSTQEDEGLQNLAVEDTGSGYDVWDCMMDAEGTGEMQAKIYSGEVYLSDFLAPFLSSCSNRSNTALFGLVCTLLQLMDSSITRLIPETENLGTYRRYSRSSSLLVGGTLYKDTTHVRPFFSWLRACSKGLCATDQDHSRCQNINTGLDLYCSLIKFFTGQALHLYGMKYFELHSSNSRKNQLILRISESNAGKSKQNYFDCKRFKDPYRETEIYKHECVQIKDSSNIHMETKTTIPGCHKRHRKIYKLAPTFQYPRILSVTQMCTWRNSCNVASSLFAETDGMLTKQNILEDDRRKLVTNESKDELTRKDISCRSEDTRVCEACIYEDDLYPMISKCSDSDENLVVTSYSSFLPVVKSCTRLCLPEQFAKRLVEQFGCPGVELDAFEPKDFIVPLGHSLAQRIYKKWKASLEVKYKFHPAK